MPWHGSSAVAKWGGSKYGDTRRQSRVERWEMAASADWDIALGPIDFHDVMLTEYIDEALRRARYELIEDEEPPTTERFQSCRACGRRAERWKIAGVS